jgi:RecB family endonuclease NucS
MRVIIADCEVTYEGRGSTYLPRAKYALIIKDDGCIAVHKDQSNKPVNYMGKGTSLRVASKGRKKEWVFFSKKESITILIHKIIRDDSFDLDGNPPDLMRFKTENQLQEWISKHPEAVGKGFKHVEREYRTGVGSIDLLMKDAEGNYVIVEVKRKAMIDAVDQVQRYVNWLNEYGELGTVRGIVVALDVRPNTLKHAVNNDVECIEITNYN